jgi:hypothetical protein
MLVANISNYDLTDLSRPCLLSKVNESISEVVAPIRGVLILLVIG